MIPLYEDLPLDLKKILDPQKPKMLIGIAKGLAPVPPALLLPAWCYLAQDSNAEISSSAIKSLTEYPEKMLIQVVQGELPTWALDEIGLRHRDKEDILQALLLNSHTSNSFFVEIAKICSEKISVIITNNQERIIDAPEIIPALESNPQNLRSNTDRLRHFLRLAGVNIPGEKPIEEETPPEAVAETPRQLTNEEAGEKAAELPTKLSEEQFKNLTQFIAQLNVGGRVKLAVKGNKEARSLLIKDTNKVVALAVLKSPKITENEVVHYSALKSLSDDVVRVMATNPAWTKLYPLKINLCLHPKTPLQQSMQFLKFLNLRDLTKLSKEKNIPSPLQKAAKELLLVKRK